MARRGRPITVGRIKHLVREAEMADRALGQRGTGATGFTLLKMTANPLARLVDSRKIGPEELQAAAEISLAFHAMAGALMLRPRNMERTDRSHGGAEPTAVIDAQRRYRVWADHWTWKRKAHNDRTLEIVIAAVIDERSLASIDADIGRREGTASRATVRGLRDYAARAGWVRGKLAEKWRAEASNTFGALDNGR